MSRAGRLFKDAYFSIDTRVLACFRIVYGCVLCYDLIRRARELQLLYSNDGILPNHFLLYAPQTPYQFSIYTAFSTPGEVAVAFALTGLVYLAYLAGLYTRAAQILALVCLTSLNQRNLFFEDGGMSTTIALAVWTVFLPLGQRFSIDALRREARVFSVKERVVLRRRAAEPVTSLAVTAIILQIVTIYCFNVVHKAGVTWRDGTAVHYVLWQNRVDTWFGNWLAYHEPAWLSPISTRLTILFESIIPLLVLSPVYRVYTRTVAFLLALALHGGIALVMTLGPFSYAMISLVSLMIPPEALAAVLRRMPRRSAYRVLRLRARLVRWLSRLRPPPVPRAVEPSEARVFVHGFGHNVREFLVVLVMIASAVEVCADNRAMQRIMHVEKPPPIAAFIGYLRMIQAWHMFAPEAPVDDGMLVIDARTAGGEHIDPFTGKAPDFEIGMYEPVPETMMQCDVLFALRVGNEIYRDQFNQYLLRWHSVKDRPERDRIVAFDVWWINHHSPLPGSVQPYDYRKELMYSYP